VERLRGQDILVLDGLPRLAEMTRAIPSLSDVVLVPVKALLPELWATQDMLRLLKESGKAAATRIVWMRYRSHLALAQVLSREADRALGLAALGARLGHRVTRVEALGSGRTAADLSDQLGDEVLTLTYEVNKAHINAGVPHGTST